MIIKSTLRIALIVAAGMLALTASSGRAEFSRRDAQALAKTGLIYIATVRKDGKSRGREDGLMVDLGPSFSGGESDSDTSEGTRAGRHGVSC